MRHSLTMQRMYANGTISVRALPAIIGSIPSFLESFAKMPQSIGESRQLPAILRDRGYETSFFCGSHPNSMGFDAYSALAGVQNFRSKHDYEAVHGTGDDNGTWGIWDEKFLLYMCDEMTQMREPFYSSVFTICSHHPHTMPAEYEDVITKDKAQSRRLVTYVDHSIRKFYERCSQQSWFDRTLFVFVADHHAPQNIVDSQFPEDHQIIGFIHTPDGSLTASVDAITQQIDIMPTLLGLLNNREPYFAFGRDILNEHDREAWSVECLNTFVANTEHGTISIDESDRLKALVQQYYRHIMDQSYVVK